MSQYNEPWIVGKWEWTAHPGEPSARKVFQPCGEFDQPWIYSGLNYGDELTDETKNRKIVCVSEDELCIDPEYAKRITACVNACRGISNEVLTSGSSELYAVEYLRALGYEVVDKAVTEIFDCGLTITKIPQRPTEPAEKV